jgi:hypothetical protein
MDDVLLLEVAIFRDAAMFSPWIFYAYTFRSQNELMQLLS